MIVVIWPVRVLGVELALDGSREVSVQGDSSHAAEPGITLSQASKHHRIHYQTIVMYIPFVVLSGP